MKIEFLLLLFLIVCISCREIPTENYEVEANVISAGQVYITSYPSGAHISVNGYLSGKVTPDTIANLIPGTHKLSLSMEKFRDTTVNVQIQAGKLRLISIALKVDVVY